MKSEMPFRGVPKPPRERLLRTLRRRAPHRRTPTSCSPSPTTLWTAAAYREERYLAIALPGHRRYCAGWAGMGRAPYGRWIVTGGWWDFTDEITSRHVAPLLRAHRAELTPVLRGWIATRTGGCAGRR